MTKDEYDKLPPIQCNGEDLIIIDETNSISDHTVRPAQGANRKRIEQYWEDVKKFRPQDYEEWLKEYRPQEYEEWVKNRRAGQ